MPRTQRAQGNRDRKGGRQGEQEDGHACAPCPPLLMLRLPSEGAWAHGEGLGHPNRVGRAREGVVEHQGVGGWRVGGAERSLGHCRNQIVSINPPASRRGIQETSQQEGSP